MVTVYISMKYRGMLINMFKMENYQSLYLVFSPMVFLNHY